MADGYQRVPGTRRGRLLRREDKAAFGEHDLIPGLGEEIRRRLPQRPEAFHYCYGVDVLLGELATAHPGGAPAPDVIAEAVPVRNAMFGALAEPRLVSDLAVAAAVTGGAHFYPDPGGFK